MKPGGKHQHSSGEKNYDSHKLLRKSSIRKRSHCGKHKYRGALKRYWKFENKPLVAQVFPTSHSEERQPPKRRFFPPTDYDLSSEESSSEKSLDVAVSRNTETEGNINDEEYESSSSDESELKQHEMNIVMAQKTGFCIIVVNHPMSFTINGTMLIKVLSGSVNVLGYKLDASKDFVPIYSANDAFHVCVETTSHVKKDLMHLNALETELDKIAHKEQVLSIQNVIKDTSVLMIFRKNPYANFVEFAQSYIPCALPLCTSKNSEILVHLGFTIDGVKKYSVRPSEALHSAADVVISDVYSFVANRTITKTPRILIRGQRGLGKSTSLRFLINKLLSSGVKEKIFYLDIDPGQPEFTLPSCISLTEVQKPLLGPSYTHLQPPKKCKFFGGLTIDVGGKYFNCLQDVIDYYITEFSDCILFINTLGWVKDLGLEALEKVRETLKPTIEIELYQSNKSGPLDINIRDLKKFDYPRKLRIPSDAQKPTRTSIIPSTRRSIAVLSYFGKLMLLGSRCKSMESFKPCCVPATALAIHVIRGELMEFEQLLRTINASIVALCVVDDSELIHSVDDTQSKRLLPESRYGDCIGFGFVRNVDLAKKMLYIVTPVEWIKLRKVNALIKGDLIMPKEVFLMQSLCSSTNSKQGIPYVQAPIKNTIIGKKVPRRTYREKQ